MTMSCPSHSQLSLPPPTLLFMVHRPADSRLLTNLLQHEKEYSKQLNQLLDTSSASLASFAAYAAASPPPASQVIMAIAGTLAAADEALKRYRQGVEEWRDNMRMLKEMEDEVGNIMRDREILVNRLIKASKSQKQSSGSIRDSLLLGHQPFPSSSTLSLQDSPSPPPSRPLSASFSSSTKLAAAQSELQACETHLAAKERELAAKRAASVRDGLGARARAMIECGWAWSQLGKEALRTLETLREQDRPASDVSSIGPSQSASQITHHEDTASGASASAPPPPISSIMSSGILGDLPPPPPPPPPPLSADPRPPSGTTTTTTTSSLFYTPATATTYKLETVTYAPAVALHVPPSNINANVNTSPGAGAGASQATATPFAPVTNEIHNDDSTHRNVHLPAPHALDGYAYDIPMAEPPAAVAGPSRAYSPVKGLRRQGTSSGYSTPTRQGSPFTGRHVLERRITEEELKRASAEIAVQGKGQEEDEDGSTEEDDHRLVSGGKLAVVENPRFMSEARKRELEKERERAEKERREEAERERRRAEEAEREQRRKEKEEEKRKGKQKEEEEERVVEPTKEKNRFSLRPQKHHAPESGRPEDSPTKTDVPTSSPSKPTSNTSPSKGLFGTLRGLFGKHPSPKKARSGTITADDADVSSDSDDDTTASPSKRGGLFRSRWKGHAKSKSSVSPSKWESRTEKNVRQLLAETPRAASFDEEAGRGVVKVGAVARSGTGSAVHLGSGQEPRKPLPRMRSVSDTGVVGASSPSGGRRLKKNRTGPPVAASAAAASAALSSSSTPAHIPTRSASTSGAQAQARPSARASATSNEMTPTGKRRSASIDIAVENRRSFIEEEMERDSSGGEMIVDLGKRRRRAASEIGGASASPTTPVRAQMGPIPTAPAPAPVLVSREPARQQTTPAPAPVHVKGYSSDTAAVAPLASMKRKKSLTKKKTQAASTSTPSAPVPVTSSSAPPPATTSTSAKKLSTKSPKSTGAMASKTSLAHPSGTPTTIAIGPSTTATVLPATGGTPSGTLVPQEGWAAQSQAPGGSLSRNSSILSAASAPPGSGGGPVKGKKQKRTTLGQGMGNSTGDGLARHASLGSPPAPASSSLAHGSTTQPDATSAGGVGGLVHPAAAPPSLMSIVEDVARGNREGWGQDTRKSVGGSQIPSGLAEVVRAPPRLTRNELDRIGSLEVKAKAAAGAGGSAGAGPAAGSAGSNLFQIKAPGSVFDVRRQQQQQSTEAEGAEAPRTAKTQRSTSVQDKGKKPIRGPSTPASSATGPNANAQPPAPAPAVKMPLRSALRNPSPSPSPQPHPHPHTQPGPSILHRHPLPASNVATTSHVFGSRSSPQIPEPMVRRDKGKGKAPPPQEDSANESSADDTGNEVFYSDEEEVERLPPGPLAPLAQPAAKDSTSGQGLANGHAEGYGSEVSESTASTALASTGQTPTQIPRRRKSVRVSLQPTFSPSPPAIDYDDEEEARAHAPWAWEQDAHTHREHEHVEHGHVHAPVAVPAAQPKTIAATIDIWADSSDEDESYARAKRMLSRAAKKEKDVTLMVANRM
ncbi:unnamed protein product [Cyclocybe aegerita]|uniref:Uncharacterized protein n=1 Tax=Cyclocybe aegerita TaxID=1973307 RepID=A0A8S0XVZ5_CYCAE|nr:unnamed protein product [Cyclocybe aegerita]